MTAVCSEFGAQAGTYLTRSYGRFPPSLYGETFNCETAPDPSRLVAENGYNLVVPMSIDWARQPWANDLIHSAAQIFCPIGEGLRIERERDFARQLCQRYGVPYPTSHLAHNRLDAEEILRSDRRPFVIKNPLCAPGSPIHTIVCETPETTENWLGRINYSEGVFLQEYLGTAEAGHIALVRNGTVYSMVTNQEYKRAFTGNMGVTAGAPLGGIVEFDPEDKYGIAAQTLKPLEPWFQAVNYTGPIQVTAIRQHDQWNVIEYNVRTGITASAILLRQLKNPAETFHAFLANQPFEIQPNPDRPIGVSITLAGYGYPYIQLEGPDLPVEVDGTIDCDIWWNEARRDTKGAMWATGHRIADVVACAPTLEQALNKAYSNIRKLRSPGSYYRTDIGKTLWPPGNP